ncbi:hypothetical protein F5Y16DRAFT_93637 [Xylariaceae sp. FL0255]|nr:hypothetical protein F5Y16DRAFT_93637 [Xylariaceae sp. FL0255]
MASLLKFSNEILLEIASFLVYHEPSPLTQHVGFDGWVNEIQLRNILAFRLFTRDLKSLSYTCRRLHRVTSVLLYAQIPLLYRDDRKTEALIETLDNHQDLTSLLKIVHVNVERFHDPPIDFHSLFFLPNIQELSIKGCNAWDGWDGDKAARVGTSSVQVLRLLKCGAHETPLTEMLSWPRNLKELWYDVEQGEWDGHYEGDEATGFSCTAVARAMSSLVGSLEKFVFSRPPLDHEGLGYSTLLNLRSFEKLKSLWIYHVFLVAWESEEAKVWEHFPRSLEELDVFYDDHDCVTLFGDDAPTPNWLFGLLDRIKEGQDFTPSLRRIRLSSDESIREVEDYSDDEDERFDGKDFHLIPGFDEARGYIGNNYTWRPPRMLVEKFISANVSFTIGVDQGPRYVYVVEGGQGFEDD